MKLRPYQEDILIKTRNSMLKGNRSPLIVSPCGSGKTVMFSCFTKRTIDKGKRVLILAHRYELLKQIGETLSKFNVNHRFIASGRFFHPECKVQVASVLSVVRRLDRLKAPDLIIIDEAHHVTKGSAWSKVLNYFPNAWKIGVTASPCRLSGEGLGEIFDDIIIGPSTSDLINIKALSPYKIYAPKSINTQGVHIKYGDFAKNELSDLIDKPKITGDIIKYYRKLGMNKRAIVFCVSINHAKHVASSFISSGFNASSIDGKIDKKTREKIIDDFKSGKIKVLTSCDLVSEGFDLPAIEVAIMLRPTKSLGLWIQQTGRALRICEGKSEAIIIDHVNGCITHGLPDDEREWSLDGKKTKKKDEEADLKVKTCPKCFNVQRIGKPACDSCGHIFEGKPREVDEVDGELVEVDVKELRRKRLKEQSKAKDKEDLIELGKKRGYKRPHLWALHIIKARNKKYANI